MQYAYAYTQVMCYAYDYTVWCINEAIPINPQYCIIAVDALST